MSNKTITSKTPFMFGNFRTDFWRTHWSKNKPAQKLEKKVESWTIMKNVISTCEMLLKKYFKMKRNWIWPKYQTQKLKKNEPKESRGKEIIPKTNEHSRRQRHNRDDLINKGKSWSLSKFRKMRRQNLARVIKVIEERTQILGMKRETYLKHTTTF